MARMSPIAFGLRKGKVKVAYEALTVNRLANQIKIKALDAAIVWDAVAKQYPGDIDIVPIEDSNSHAVALAMGLLSQSKNKALARQFAEFAAGDFGAKCFRENHYQVPGKELRVGCGASMRAPVEDLAMLFQKQTGYEVLRDDGSSGTVLLQIQAPASPADATLSRWLTFDIKGTTGILTHRSTALA